MTTDHRGFKRSPGQVFWVFDEHKVAWPRICKAGTCSTRTAAKHIPHRTASYRDLDDRGLYEPDNDWFFFCFVRHPLDRIVSAWAFFDKNRIGVAPFKTWALDVMGKQDKHWMPQHLYTDGFRLDFVGKLETLSEDWRRLRELRPDMGLRETLPHLNSSPHRDWQDYMTPKLERQLRDYYARDFELFGYE